jgi:hypothetical protein
LNRLATVTAALLGMSVALAAQPAPKADPQGLHVDAQAGFHLQPPAGWRPLDPTGFAVPGTFRAGWAPIGLSSIVVFTVHLENPVNAAFLLKQQQAAARRQHADVSEARQREIAGKQAMSFRFTAAGTGGAVDPQGELATSQHWIAIPHQREILFLLLTAPADEFEGREGDFERLLATLVVDGAQTEDQAVPR